MASLCPNCGVELPGPGSYCPRCSTADPKPKPDAMTGKVVDGRYRITRRLGAGGMGVVYEAEHVGVGQKVAIKFLHAAFSADPETVRRFKNEAKSYAQIIHPHAIQLHDFGQDADGNLFISMEYLEGRDLKRTLTRDGRLSPKDAIEIAQQVADVLATAHARGIIHRDLKPENIMLTRELRGYHVKVLDFGLARLAAQGASGSVPGMICGTPRYMAPEQADGGEMDHRVDIYALGLVLFESLTGTHPFDAPSITETLVKQCTLPVPHLWEAVPGLRLAQVDAAIQRATAKSRESRFGSMLEFAHAFSDDPGVSGVGLSGSSPAAAIPLFDEVSPGATMPSAARRAAAAAPAAPAPASTPEPAPPVEATLPKAKGPGRTRVLAAVAGAVTIAAVCAVAWLSSTGAKTSELRSRLDAFYLANREPVPPEACREKDAERLENLVTAAGHLSDALPDAARAKEATTARGALLWLEAGSPESAFVMGKAQSYAGQSAATALSAATSCAGFAAAENLAGTIASREGRTDEADLHFLAAIAASASFAKPRFNRLESAATLRR